MNVSHYCTVLYFLLLYSPILLLYYILLSLTGWELSQGKIIAMTEENQKLLSSILPYLYPDKTSLLFLTPHLHFANTFWFCTRETVTSKPLHMLTSELIDTENDEVCYAIMFVILTTNTRATCPSTVPVCFKFKKIWFFFYFCTGIAHSTGCYHSHQSSHSSLEGKSLSIGRHSLKHLLAQTLTNKHKSHLPFHKVLFWV